MAGTTFIQAIKGATPTVAGVTKLSDTSGIAMSVDDVTAAIPNKNYIINGNFDIWQRGTSQTTDGYGSDDRWYNSNSISTKVHTQEEFAVGQTDVPNNPKYYSRTVVVTGGTTASRTAKFKNIEDVSTFTGQNVTLSFWAKADANKNFGLSFEQVFGTGGSAKIKGIGLQLVPITTSWKKYEIVIFIPSISGKTVGADSSIGLGLWFDAGNDHVASSGEVGTQSGTFDIAQVKLEKGSVATEFEPKTYAEELRDCQRYYEKLGLYSIAGVSGAFSPGMRANFVIQFETKRVIPTFNGTWIVYNGSLAPSITSYTNKVSLSFDIGTWVNGYFEDITIDAEL